MQVTFLKCPLNLEINWPVPRLKIPISAWMGTKITSFSALVQSPDVTEKSEKNDEISKVNKKVPKKSFFFVKYEMKWENKGKCEKSKIKHRKWFYK